MEALGRKDRAQAFRWQCFERALNSAHLRAYLKRLPDFDDIEAEERAMSYTLRCPSVHRALAFLVSWPALDKAAADLHRLTCQCRSKWINMTSLSVGLVDSVLGVRRGWSQP